MTGTGLSFEQVAGEVEKLQWIPDMDQKSLDAIREVMEQVCAEHKSSKILLKAEKENGKNPVNMRV